MRGYCQISSRGQKSPNRLRLRQGAHLYLMDNSFVTGTVLTVDGGAVLL